MRSFDYPYHASPFSIRSGFIRRPGLWFMWGNVLCGFGSLLLHSLRKAVILKIFEWMLADDLNLARKIARYEIPKLLKRLKEGDPVVLVLIRVKGITDPMKNHQVVAAGYEYEETILLRSICMIPIIPVCCHHSR